jgi:16S rRNA (adenine1518-N6/adenine1519-N6)-dimethyltransferase
MKLSEMRELLRDREIALTRSLGQNFLHDANQLRRIIRLADLAVGDRILEIGPGLGPLTGCLLEAGCEVLAIEQDARLVAFLRERWPNEPRLAVEQADALKLLRTTPHDWSGWKLVANLPYSVASPILVDLALANAPPERMVVTLQAEVARRLAAGPGGADYGILTLLVQVRFAPGESFGIPRRSFHPPPNVDSTCVRLDRRSEPMVATPLLPVFRKLVKCAFSQRRKKMLKLLKTQWPEDSIRAALHDLDLREDIRAEKVSLSAFAELTRRLAENHHE